MDPRLRDAIAGYARRDLAVDPLTPDERAILARLAWRVRRSRGCVRVRGYRSKDGYAYFRAHKRRLLVHRWLYETFNGDAAGLDVDHHCTVRDCAAHLRALPPWKNRGWREPASPQ